MANALDPGLANLDRNERAGIELPITLKRFRDHLGAESAIAAMQQATAQVLGHYAENTHRAAARISASALCKTCGVALLGNPPPRDRRRAVYSSFRNLETDNGHSGTLRLDPRQSKIQLPPGLDHVRARVAVAHELGHYLIHRRGDTLDSFTARLPSSAEEEALSEYAARLLLLPSIVWDAGIREDDLPSQCLKIARSSDVTLHSAVARLGDPDSPYKMKLKGVILWRLNPGVSVDKSVAGRLTPQWHLCPDEFIPIRRCHAGRDSLVAELASSSEATAASSRVESVKIGSLNGSYRVTAVAWGSVRRGSRLVLSAFLLP